MKGVDVKIEALRELFETRLFTSSDYISYRRAFITLRDGKFIPELQTLSSTDYKEVLLNSASAGHSFFVVDSELDAITPIDFSADVSIYFAVNLHKLYVGVPEREVEYMHKDVMEYINMSAFKIQSIITGLKAFEEFDNVKEGDNLEPFYLVRFKTKVEYTLNESINIKC